MITTTTNILWNALFPMVSAETCCSKFPGIFASFCYQITLKRMSEHNYKSCFLTAYLLVSADILLLLFCSCFEECFT